VLEQTDPACARKVTEFLKATDRYDKTIIFCEDIDHASGCARPWSTRTRICPPPNRKYVMRITGDSPEGKARAGQLHHPKSGHPVIVTRRS